VPAVCKPCECNRARERKSNLEDALRKADFADAAYAAEDGNAPDCIQCPFRALLEKCDAECVHGFKDISNDVKALNDYGLTKDDLTIPNTNFRAVIYRKGKQTIVSFKGTTSWFGSDMRANIQQALDIRDGDAPTAYYKRAQGIARLMKTHALDKGHPLPEFIGHSLGAGLASAAAQATGAPATLFNPAGLNPATVTGPMSGSPVKAVKVIGEIISGGVNEIPGLPDAYSTEDLMLDPPIGFGRDILMQGAATMIGAGLGGPWGATGGLAAAKLVRAGLLHTRENVRDALAHEIDKADRAIVRYCG